MYRLEDVTSYGNHNKLKLQVYSTSNYKIRNLSLHPNGLTDLIEIWNSDFLGHNASFECDHSHKTSRKNIFWDTGS